MADDPFMYFLTDFTPLNIVPSTNHLNKMQLEIFKNSGN